MAGLAGHQRGTPVGAPGPGAAVGGAGDPAALSLLCCRSRTGLSPSAVQVRLIQLRLNVVSFTVKDARLHKSLGKWKLHPC